MSVFVFLHDTRWHTQIRCAIINAKRSNSLFSKFKIHHRNHCQSFCNRQSGMLNFSSAFGYMHATIRFRHCSSVVFAVNKARRANDYFTPGNVQVARTFLWISFSHSINSIQACAFVPMDSRSINTNKPTGIWPTILVVSGFLISICWFFFSPIMVQLHAIFCRTITLHFFPFQMRLKFVLTAILEEQEFWIKSSITLSISTKSKI